MRLLEVKRLAPDVDDAAAFEEEIGADQTAKLEAQIFGAFRQSGDSDQRGAERIFAQIKLGRIVTPTGLSFE